MGLEVTSLKFIVGKTVNSRGAQDLAGLTLLLGGLASVTHFDFVPYRDSRAAPTVMVAPCCQPWDCVAVFAASEFVPVGCY